MSNLEASYNLILRELRKISGKENFYLKDIKHQLSDCIILGDKGYLSANNSNDWFELKPCPSNFIKTFNGLTTSF